MTENMRAILRRWKRQLFTEEIKREHNINEHAIWSAASLVELDEAYTRRISGFKDLDEFYFKNSCVSVWDNIKVPMIFINAVDDPIVAPQLLEKVKQAAERHSNFLYIEQKYGGHLGFYEGGLVYPNPLTWLDRLVVQMSDALVMYACDGKIKAGLEDLSKESSDQEGENSARNAKEDRVANDSHTDSDGDSATTDLAFFLNKTRDNYSTTRPSYVCRKRANLISQKNRLGVWSLENAKPKTS